MARERELILQNYNSNCVVSLKLNCVYTILQSFFHFLLNINFKGGLIIHQISKEGGTGLTPPGVVCRGRDGVIAKYESLVEHLLASLSLKFTVKRDNVLDFDTYIRLRLYVKWRNRSQKFFIQCVSFERDKDSIRHVVTYKRNETCGLIKLHSDRTKANVNFTKTYATFVPNKIAIPWSDCQVSNIYTMNKTLHALFSLI